MSDIIEARRLLHEASVLHKKADELIQKALRLMTRERAVRRSRPTRVYIDEKTRRRVAQLALDPNISMTEIANIVGLASQGRVSEILNGLR